MTGHGGAYGEVNGGDFGKVAVAWLNWRLRGDIGSGQMFLGPRCGLCTDPGWVVTRKGFDEPTAAPTEARQEGKFPRPLP
jgi:hypothetical protein